MADIEDPRGPAGRPDDNSESNALELGLKQLLSQGEVAARSGRRGEARRLFREALALEPTNEHAWLWLAYLAPSPRQSLAYLQQVRAYHPSSKRVRAALDWASERLAEEEAARQRSRRAQPQARPARPVELPPPSPVRAMARPRVASPTQRRSRWPLVALALCGLALVGAAIGYALSARPPAMPSPPPTSWLEGTPAADMATLREQANQAITREDWEAVIPILEQMRLLSPDDDGVRQQLAIAHLRRGLQLVEEDRIDEAVAHYDAAIRFYANDMDLQTARRLAIGYRDGRLALTQGRWDEAVALLDPVYAVAPDFRDVATLLFTALIEQARALDAGHQLAPARDAYARALAVRPESEEAQARLAELNTILTPPTPTPTPRPRKRIEVSISEQRLRAYENDAVVFDWLCSTGIPTMPTRYGDFEILDKIPEAWSSAWGLRMPYWMGIYWAGGSENGIHALPILPGGDTLWAGYLGRPVSFGCVVLDTPNAATLYEWAEIGTPVKIVP